MPTVSVSMQISTRPAARCLSSILSHTSRLVRQIHTRGERRSSTRLNQLWPAVRSSKRERTTRDPTRCAHLLEDHMWGCDRNCRHNCRDCRPRTHSPLGCGSLSKSKPAMSRTSGMHNILNINSSDRRHLRARSLSSNGRIDSRLQHCRTRRADRRPTPLASEYRCHPVAVAQPWAMANMMVRCHAYKAFAA